MLINDFDWVIREGVHEIILVSLNLFYGIFFLKFLIAFGSLHIVKLVLVDLLHFKMFLYVPITLSNRYLTKISQRFAKVLFFITKLVFFRAFGVRNRLINSMLKGTVLPI